MPLAFTGNATITSVNAPGALVQLITACNRQEVLRNASNSRLAAINNVSWTVDGEGPSFVATATFPFTKAETTLGAITRTIPNYLGTFGDFVPGASEIQSSNLAAAIVELAEKMAGYERSLAIDDRPDYVQIAEDNEAGTVEISCNIPIDLATVELAAIDYP
jgi:hypothetical protein